MNAAVDHAYVAIETPTLSTGCICWWRLSESTAYSSLRDAWSAEGLEDEDLPKPPSPAVALRRAMHALRDDARFLVRPLGHGRGFALVRESVTDGKLSHLTFLSAALNKVGQLVVTAENLDPMGEGYQRRAAQLQTAFDVQQDALSTEDVSAWLTRYMPKLDAVGLRDTGGVYFVPQGSVNQLEQVGRAFRVASAHLIHRVPAMRSQDAVAAILDALEQEASNEAQRMEGELTEDTLGERGLRNRVNQCDALEQKLTRYEELLDGSLGGIRGRLAELRAGLAAAALLAMASEDSAV